MIKSEKIDKKGIRLRQGGGDQRMKKIIYCGECKFCSDYAYCKSEPKKRDTSYFAPDSHKLIHQLCSLKNQKNKADG